MKTQEDGTQQNIFEAFPTWLRRVNPDVVALKFMGLCWSNHQQNMVTGREDTDDGVLKLLVTHV